MDNSSPDQYLKSVILELEAAYQHYNQVRDQFASDKKHWKSLSLYNYLRVEKESMSRIRIREKVISGWLKDNPGLISSLAQEIESLESLRQRTVRENAHLMNEIRSAMNSLRSEQKSLRLPRRKPIKKESVPSLIDIKL